MEYILGALGGVIFAWIVGWAFVVRPLIRDVRTMRYRGFIGELPREPAPPPEVAMPNEGLY